MNDAKPTCGWNESKPIELTDADRAAIAEIALGDEVLTPMVEAAYRAGMTRQREIDATFALKQADIHDSCGTHGTAMHFRQFAAAIRAGGKS